MEQHSLTASTSEPVPPERRLAFVTDVGALGILQALQRLPGLILLPIVSKGLGAGAYGLWTLFFVAGEILGIMCDLALDDALVRFVPGIETRDERAEYFYSLVLTVAGLSLFPALTLALFAGPSAVWLFGGAQHSLLALLLAIYLVMEALDNMALNMLRGLLQVKLFVYLEASQLVVRTVMVAAAFLAGLGLPVALLAYLATQLAWLLIEFGMVYSRIGLRWPTFKYIRPCLAYSLPLVPTRCSSFILTYSDRLIIARVLGPAAVGVYAACYDLALLIWHIFNPVRVALYPTVSQLWDDGRRRDANQLLTLSMKYSLLLAVPAIVGLGAQAPHLLRLLATEEFAQASTLIVPIASVGVLMGSLAVFFNLLLRLHRRTRLIAASLVISAALHLLLNLILIPTIGLMGGAIATLAGYACDVLLSGWFAWRYSQFDLPVRSFAISLVAALVMLPVMMWAGAGHDWVSLLRAGMAGAAVYTAALFMLRGVTKYELGLIWAGR